MKTLLQSLLCLLALATASWTAEIPKVTWKAGELARVTDERLGPLLKGYEYLYLTPADYRMVTIHFDVMTQTFVCDVPVAYFSLGKEPPLAEDSVKGFVPRPEKSDPALSSHCSDLGRLVGILDSNGIESQRASTIFKATEAAVTGINNRLQFKVPMIQRKLLFDFFQAYYSQYPPEVDIHAYTSGKQSSG